MFRYFRTDAGAAGFAFATSLAIVGAWVAARAARDALFLSVFPIDTLPRMMLGAAALSLGSAAGISVLLGRYGPARVVPAGFAVSASFFLSEWLLMPTAPNLVSAALYLHLAVLGGVLISGFWSVLSERFDPYTGKTILARTGAFGALGGVVGGLAAERVGALGGISPMLFGLCLAHAVCAAGVVGIGAPPLANRRGGSEPARANDSGLAILRRTPLLRAMALMMITIATIEALLDFTLKAAVAERFPDEASLIRFFALFEMSVGASAFLVQSLLGGRILHRFGLGWAMAVRPALVALTAFGGAVLARFWTTVLVRAVDALAMRSTFNSGFELLYTPLTPETKRPTKVYVDIVSTRVGDIAGAGLVIALLALLPSLPSSFTLGLAAVISVAALLLIRRVQELYVEQLAENLQSGAIRLDQSESLDALTSRTVFGSSTGSGQGIDRDEIMAQIQAAKASTAERVASRRRVTARPDDELLSQERAELFDRITAIESDDPVRVRAALVAARDDLRLVTHVIHRVGPGRIGDAALVFLRALAPQVAGQLTDALLDPKLPISTRRILPRVLELGRSARSVEGLVLGLDAEDFELREACARSAARAISRDANLAIPLNRAAVHAEREFALDRAEWSQGLPERTHADDPVLLDRVEAAHVNRRVEHVFTLLSLALGPPLMAATLRSLYGSDGHLRGTALEYLQTSLPDSLRAALWDQVPGAKNAPTPKRPSQQMAAELLQTSQELARPDSKR